ncbi:phosphotransferase enzyme family protein [Kribbella lupini]|uniref:Aminoglycoside phosphotransferase domain-containing protein n=1 Tax=Kribbella lupini TaxID=291602 RepID=A0ABN2CEF8_9ACTN
MVRTLRSLPHPDGLRDHLAEVYALPFTGCSLVRSLVNDVYRLTTPTGAYVLKLYAGRPVAEIRWEAGLSGHLLGKVATPPIQPLADGATCGALALPEGDRPFVLTAFVDGRKPQPPFGDELYREFGELIARFHLSASTYMPGRRAAEHPDDLDRLVGEIVPLVSPADAEVVRALAAAVPGKVAEGASRGVRHGDVSMDNVLVAPDGLNLHDFDLAGEGFLAADFCGVASTPYWQAFRDGYQRHREISTDDLAAIDWLGVAGRIANLHFHLVRKPQWYGTESRGEGWAAGELAELRLAAGRLL